MALNSLKVVLAEKDRGCLTFIVRQPLYGKSRTDDVMKTPSKHDLSARHLCNPPAIKLPEGVARH